MDSSVLWCGTLWSKSVEERLEAADAGGFTEVSIFPTDIAEFAEEPYHEEFPDADSPESAIRSLAADYEADVTIFDPFVQWVPDWSPPDPDAVPPLFDTDEDELFRRGDALGIDSLTVLEPFGETLGPAAAATAFGRLCDRAADHGWRVHLEFIPFTGIPDLATAWDIVERADRDNGGLLFDTWHFYRGTADEELLRTIPGEKIYRVQVADAPAESQYALREESLHHRRLPGEGDLNLLSPIRTLDDIGGLNSVGIEVISDDLDERPATEIGTRCRASLDDLLASAGVDAV